jgi:hypothetical protein
MPIVKVEKYEVNYLNGNYYIDIRTASIFVYIKIYFIPMPSTSPPSMGLGGATWAVAALPLERFSEILTILRTLKQVYFEWRFDASGHIDYCRISAGPAVPGEA